MEGDDEGAEKELSIQEHNHNQAGVKEANDICQIDGHNTINSVTSSEEESEHLSESENDNASKD